MRLKFLHDFNYLSYLPGNVRCEIHSAVDQEVETGAHLSKTQYPSNKNNYFSLYPLPLVTKP